MTLAVMGTLALYGCAGDAPSEQGVSAKADALTGALGLAHAMDSCSAGDATCCASGQSIKALTTNSDTLSEAAAGQCVVAGDGSDTLFFYGAGSVRVVGGAGSDVISANGAGSAVVYAGEGDDTVMGGSTGSVLVGGPGRDTLFAYGGDDTVLGGNGDDTIFAGDGNNFVVPGPGVDTVFTGTGDDTVAIFDECELQWGKLIEAGTGRNTLYTPVSVAELQARGVTVSNFQDIRVEKHSCLSDCVAKPDCGGHGQCAEGDGAGQVKCACDDGWGGPDCRTPVCPEGGRKSKPGQCGCAILDTDTDGDTVADCIDACPRDPAKSSPGVAGCGYPEIDPDGDGVVSKIDGCPLDKAQQYKGTCGCASAPAASGTVCTDGICPGKFTCDGTGNCGNPDACSPEPGKCEWRRVGNFNYWICRSSTTRDLAAASCAATPGRQLLQVTSAYDALLATELGLSGVWLAAQGTPDGTWTWPATGWQPATTFWQQGAAISGKYTAWANVSPGTGSCAWLDAGTAGQPGVWHAGACDESHSYVCVEAGVRTTPNVPSTTCPPGINCNPGKLDLSKCQDPSAMPTDLAAFQKQVADCQKNCTKEGDPGCAQDCTGTLAVPPADSTCEGTTDVIKTCSLGTIDPTTKGQNEDACSNDAGCGTGKYCRSVAIDAKGALCTCTDKRKGCSVQNCVTSKRCGTLSPNCGTASTESRCGETLLCDPRTQLKFGTLDPLKNPGSSLASEPYTGADFPKVPDAPLTYPDDAPKGSGFGHSWCHYDLPKVDPRNVGDGKKGQSGDGGVVSFDFDPKLVLDYGVTPLPLGAFRFNVTAEAGATASATASLPLLDPVRVDLLDANLSLVATTCSFSTANTRIVALGNDYVPPEARIDRPGTVECENSLKDLQRKADRARKAFRDALELVTQYTAAKEAGKGLPNLCAQLVGEPAPKGFPPGATNCASEPPEATINRFITFYEQEVNALIDGVSAIQGVGDVPLLQSESKQLESTTIAQAVFPIGPIPLLLQVDFNTDYGVNFNLGLDVQSPSALVRGDPFRPVTLTGAASPYGSASISMFVGVGIDFGIGGASAGVDGNINLATISVPVNAQAGIEVAPVDDPRKLPDDIAAYAAGTVTPRKQYDLRAFYGVGMSAGMKDILRAELSARLRIKFLFFSKTWRAVIAQTEGFDLPPVDLLHASDSLGVALGTPDWAHVQMPSPFVGITRVKASPPAANTVPVDTSRVGKFLYDSQCTCAEANQECTRDADCCGDAPTCFADPSQGGKKVCSPCRQSGDSCNQGSDCCGSPSSICYADASNGGAKACSACHPKDQPCNSGADCCSQSPLCFKDPKLANKTVCSPACRSEDESCNSDADCCDVAGKRKCRPRFSSFSVCTCVADLQPASTEADCCSNFLVDGLCRTLIK